LFYLFKKDQKNWSFKIFRNSWFTWKIL
jgi:hypothetical protein